jgi:extracellular elastinolytic metalloproteinase
VYAQAQDGGGTNNANFGTPPDGVSGQYADVLVAHQRSGHVHGEHTRGRSSGEYGIATAGFGPLPPADPLTEDVVLVQDDTAPESDGCEAITNGAALAGKIALVDRGSCLFVEKVLALQAQGAVAVVVVNNVAGAPITMGGTDPGNITIPAVMISMADGQIIKDALLNGACKCHPARRGLCEPAGLQFRQRDHCA